MDVEDREALRDLIHEYANKRGVGSTVTARVAAMDAIFAHVENMLEGSPAAVDDANVIAQQSVPEDYMTDGPWRVST